jgi:hypothetical protein
MSSRFLTAAAIALSVNARFPASGVIESISAGAAKTILPSVEAAGIRSFADVSGELQWVKAKDHFLLAGETVVQGTFVQVREDVAKELLRMDRVTTVTDAELAEAKAAEATDSKAKA